MTCVLAVKSGPQLGQRFALDPDRAMHVGRGPSCEILLADPISSRFHAVLYHEDGDWHIRDTSSRNGTLVNGQKIDHARLNDQSLITIGGTDLQVIEQDFESSDSPLIELGTIVAEGGDPPSWYEPDAMSGQSLNVASWLSELYGISTEMLSQDAGGEVLDPAMERLMAMLRRHCDADAIEVTCVDDSGRTRRLRSDPAAMPNVRWARATIKQLIAGQRVSWIGHDSPDLIDRLTPHWTDALAAPLKAPGIEGLMWVMRSRDGFDRSAIPIVVAGSRLAALGLSLGQNRSQQRHDQRRVADKSGEGGELVGQSEVMTKLLGKVQRVGGAGGSVLVRGESGVGKELVARRIHRASPRHGRPMLTVNCAAIPSELIESQLFGHAKGSFTGADRDHTGWFEQANTGSLFLDEIGELPLEGQAKLLRILEGHPFLPVGATREVNVDVRVIAATNRDLAEFVREGKFREDLYYRISVFELLVPPLRDRGDDIDRLIDHFLSHFRTVHGRPNLAIDPDARRRLLDYAWPGNVRQLRNVIDSAVVMADGDAIGGEDIGLRDTGEPSLDTLRIDRWEERLIRKALERCGGSVPQASKMLGISRATTYRKISEYNIDR